MILLQEIHHRVANELQGLVGALSPPRAKQMLEPVWIDGLPDYISRERGDVLQTTALAIEDGRITAIYITRNPDKLRHVAQALVVAPDPTLRTH